MRRGFGDRSDAGHHDLQPDLSYVASAGRAVFEALPGGTNTVVVLESTVYPGVTAETWLPLLDELGLQQGVDVTIAYCPERFNQVIQPTASALWRASSVCGP